MPHTDIELRAEALLDPELFQFNLTAFLHFRLPFSRFFKLLLDSAAGAGMLEFYLRLHGPALSEVITQIDDSMRDIKASMLLSLVGCGR